MHVSPFITHTGCQSKKNLARTIKMKFAFLVFKQCPMVLVSSFSYLM